MHRTVLLLLTGCGSTTLTGTWSGECAFADYEMILDVELTQSADLLDGTAAAMFAWQGYDFEYSGTAAGSVAEDVVVLDLELWTMGSSPSTSPYPRLDAWRVSAAAMAASQVGDGWSAEAAPPCRRAGLSSPMFKA